MRKKWRDAYDSRRHRLGNAGLAIGTITGMVQLLDHRRLGPMAFLPDWPPCPVHP